MMKADPLVSIIVPVYKVEEYLRECVESILHYSHSNLEILLVDDGSPDNCPAICDEYAMIDSRIQVIHKENGGLSDARNTGIWAAKGEYVLFLDGDDLLSSDSQGQQWFSCFMSFLEQTKLDVYFFSCIEELPSKAPWKQGNAPKVVGKTRFLGRCFFTVPYQAGWLYVLKREFLLKNSLFFKEGLLHEDEEWIPRVIVSLSENHKIGLVPFPLYRYRLNRSGSITNGSNARRQGAKLYIIRTLAALYPKLSKQDKRFIATRIAQLYTGLALDKQLDLEIQKQLISFKGYLLRSQCAKHWGVYALLFIRGWMRDTVDWNPFWIQWECLL